MRAQAASGTPSRKRGLWRVLLLAGFGVLLPAGSFSFERQDGASPRNVPRLETLADMGVPSTQGAAPGYVADDVCASCHEDIARSYQSVGMSRSFFAPSRKKNIEDFQTSGFFHRPSSRYYRIWWKDDRLVFSQWQTDFRGERINSWEVPVDWILGSGTRSRTYLYQTEEGELYQLPLAWYTQSGSWGMAPGFDRPDHHGVGRIVRRECMFCHNAFPDVPKGSDSAMSPQTFPRSLPQGIGCQRCHGPGGGHVLAALESEAETKIRAAIVNPARLDAVRRGDVCLQCHLQPTITLGRPRRFGRDDYSFRPGEALTDYLVPVDVEVEGQRRTDRFEINHHPYRLRQSRCFMLSGGKLECTSCHDPHRKAPFQEAAGRYQRVCLGCHPGALGDGHPRVTARPAGVGLWGLAEDAPLEGACVVCHMPKRRPEDVVQVVMTDHLITRRIGTDEMLAPLEELKDPVLLDAALFDPARGPDGPLGKLYCATAVCEVICPPQATDFLGATLLSSGNLDAGPWMILAQAQLHLRRYAEAESTLRKVMARHSNQTGARESLALALAGQGRVEEAVSLLRASLKSSAPRSATLFNLGGLLLSLGRFDEALENLRAAVRLNPARVEAWVHLGDLHAKQGRFLDAVDCYTMALSLDARVTSAYLGVGKAFLKLGKRDEAVRFWRQGMRSAPDTAPLAKALQELFRSRGE